MNRIAKWLANSRVTGWVSLVTLLYPAAEWVVSASWRGFYSYREDPVGPLGVAFCGPQGNWPCSDLYRVTNVALVATGLAVAFVAVSLVVQRVIDRGPAAALAVGGVAFAGAGVVTQHLSYAWNSTLLAVFMTLGALNAIFVALSSSTQLTGERRLVAALAGTVAFIGYFMFIGVHDAFGHGGAQRMAIYGVLVTVIALGTAGLRTATPALVGSRE
ncbi:hypothetical protein [Mycobacterium sp. SMC-4]|uniref:hypothetical protein n=1 Tax=Mycobacterium sp. SMC-4 TaxID=2857059 RepID=UPI0021B1DC9A|nr:hypothetical protein [Mycobacterium sp. SMC-4]UXA20214.1 hypothetical protein KXD98_11920 [Mycobacterium sp. SMC-4]